MVVFYDEGILDIWSYGKYFPSLDGVLLDLVSQNLFWEKLKNIKAVGEVVLTDNFRIDLVCSQAYKSLEYWWIVLMYNGVLVEDLAQGTKLILPNPSEVAYLLAEIKIIAREESWQDSVEGLEEEEEEG